MELRTYPPAELILARGSLLTEVLIVKKGVVVAQGRVFSVGKVGVCKKAHVLKTCKISPAGRELQQCCDTLNSHDP